MKRSLLMISMLLLALTAAAPLAQAQGGAKKGRDVGGASDMETDALHNLEVARQYFKLRKAYVASLQRCEEVVAGNPAFSKIDEVLFIAGESSLNLAEGKGKQKPELYVIHDGDKKITLKPEVFRAKAREYLSQLVKDHPQSSFRGQAEDDLKSLGAAKPVSSKQ